MKNDKSQIYLSSRIVFKGRLNSNMDRVREKLNEFPGSKFIPGGRTIRFYLDVQEDRHYLFEISSSSISIETICSNNQPNYFLQDALLKLFSVAAFLSNDYSFEPSSIFPEIVEVLSKQYFNSVSTNTPNIKQEQTGDIILAKRINHLIGTNASLEASVNKLEGDLTNLTIKFIINKYGNTFLMADLEKEMLPSGTKLSETIKNIQKAGYRLIPLDKQRVSLVKP